MKCPNCPDVVLVMAERQGVEIDYCPTCRGIWLDKGELDKLLQRAETAPSPVPATGAANAVLTGDHHARGGYLGHHGRRKSWLHEIFG
jgi:Zn-finger nucleic acid-binding protein